MARLATSGNQFGSVQPSRGGDGDDDYGDGG